MPGGAKGRLAFFLKKSTRGEQDTRQENDLELSFHAAQIREKKGDTAVDQGQDLEQTAEPVGKHQPSWLTAARMRSMPSFTVSREVA